MLKEKTEETRNGGKENDEEGICRDYRKPGYQVRIQDERKLAVLDEGID